jgi:hypothetical protein
MELVIFVGEDKENWGQLTALINRFEAEEVFVIKNKKIEGFPKVDNAIEVNIDCDKPLLELKQEIIDKLKERLKGDFEVALSIASGNGKEHMALISALLCIPVGIKIVVFTKNGIEFVN